MKLPNLKPIPEALVKEAQKIMREAMFTIMENRCAELDGEIVEETNHTTPVMAKIAGAAALHGFTVKDVNFLENPTVIEIVFNETDMALKIIF